MPQTLHRVPGRSFINVQNLLTKKSNKVKIYQKKKFKKKA